MQCGLAMSKCRWRQCVILGGWTLGLMLLVPSFATAEMLGTTTVSHGGTLVGPAHRVRPKVSSNYSERGLFDETWVDSTDVGTMLEASAASDTDFAAIASRLTNGAQEHFCVGICEEISCGSLCGPESLLFGLQSTDFSPATVTKILLRIDGLSFGLDSRGGQIVLFTFTVMVEGERGLVPARPTSWGRVKFRYR
jgi:hypothetical protein